MTRITDIIEEVEKYLSELEEIKTDNIDEYSKDFKIRALYERYFEKINEALVDLAFVFIKDKEIEMPEDDEGAFDKLFKNEIITKDLSDKLKDARRMRNVMAHKYGSIDN